MKKTVIWVLGTQRSGKTHFTRKFEEYKNVKVINIGEELRKIYTISDFANDENPYATVVAEPTVCTLIDVNLLKFRRHSEYETLIIDSAPRSELQYLRLINTVSLFNNVVLFIDENRDIRLERAKSKYGDEDGVQYFNKREEKEKEWLNIILNRLHSNPNIPVIKL